MAKCKRRTQSKLKKTRLYEAQNSKCFYCGEHMSFDSATFEHLTPMSHGGGNDLSNLALACEPCNQERDVRALSSEEIARALELHKQVDLVNQWWHRFHCGFGRLHQTVNQTCYV